MSHHYAGRASPTLEILLVAALYFGVAKGGLALASIHPSASPVWPPSGIALAALLLAGLRLWPAVFIGAFLANAVTYGSALTSFLIAGGNTLEAVISAELLMRWSGGMRTFDTPLQVAKFALVCSASGTVVSPAVGVSSLTLAGYANQADAGRIWLTWWLGDVGGQLLVTPVIVLWALAGPASLKGTPFRNSAAVVAATAVIGFAAFGPLFRDTPLRTPLAFLAIVPLLWAALRYTRRDTATAAFVLCAFAIWGTLRHSVPLAGTPINDSFILVLTFVISAVVPSLILSADIALRRAVIHALARAHDLLTGEQLNRASLRDAVSKALEPFQQSQQNRLLISGPETHLNARQVLLLGMALHELATNAAKYGALSNDTGHVRLTWNLKGQQLNLIWQEEEGPRVREPAHKGFGSLLFERALTEDNVQSSLEFLPDGVRWSLSMPIDPSS